MSYRDLSLQNAKKITLIQDSIFIIQLLSLHLQVTFFTNQSTVDSLYLVFLKLIILKL